MNLIKVKNIVLKGKKDFLADAFYPDIARKAFPLLIFIHGYKGYKDWGAWELMGEAFANAGFYFVKFNFSHNGTTIDDPHNFSDLEAFGQNNYTKELEDLEVVMDYFQNQKEVDSQNVMLLGHSRGGGIAVIEASENRNIRKLATLASVSALDRFPKGEALENWKKQGVFYVENARTKQKMPHYYQFYQDFIDNRERLDVERACRNLTIPALFIHGSNDESVDREHCDKLHNWTKNSEQSIIENTNHTFGAKEPWPHDFLPKELDEAVRNCIEFLKSK